METNLAHEALAPYLTATKSGRWMWPVIGAMVALLFASFHFENPALQGFAIGLYVIGVFVAVGVQAKRSGVQPSFGAMPAELKQNMYRFWTLSAVLAAVGVVLAFLTNFLVTGAVLGLAMCGLGLMYHRRSQQIASGLLASL